MIFSPHAGLYGHRWDAMSECGHYAIRVDNAAPRASRFAALFIPGLWARGQEIGARSSQKAAETVCSEHAVKPRDITSLTTGV